MLKKTLAHGLFFVVVLAGIGCGGSNPEGNYRESNGATTLALKDGKANLRLAGIQMDATYTVDGDKVTLHPLVGDTSQVMVLTMDKDGSLNGPPGSVLGKLDKVK